MSNEPEEKKTGHEYALACKVAGKKKTVYLNVTADAQESAIVAAGQHVANRYKVAFEAVRVIDCELIEPV